jgi:predicted ArsR family transcriptional regulator
MSKEYKVLKNDREVRIYLDPLRLRIMNIYQENDDPLSAKQVADIMQLPPSKVYYHIQKLISIDLLELKNTNVINGIIAKYYQCKYKTIYLYDKKAAMNYLAFYQNS